jgi:nucleotide-binding universal stress UspA family protein
VDYVGKYSPALDLLFRLGLRKAKVVLANCASPAMLNPMYQSGIYPLLNLDIDRYVAEIGEEVLDAAAGRVLQHHKVAEKVSLMGPPASELARLAERIGADLIVVQSEQRSRTGAFFAGSVSRGLAIGASKSLLISKMTAVPTRPLRAVFATDHSAYAERAFAEFMRLAPSGIASVHVLSALDFEDLQESLPSPVTEEELELGIIAQIREKNEALVRQLKEAGFKATASFFLGDTQQAIQQAMAAHEADLLVLGAQGHGFLHRIFIGSTSLHQVVAEPHSILLLRPEMPADGEEG